MYRLEAWTSPKHRKRHQTVQLTGLGLEMGLAVAIGVFGGRYIDNWLETAPVFLFVGLGLGIGAGIKALVEVTRKVRKEWDRDDGSPDKN